MSSTSTIPAITPGDIVTAKLVVPRFGELEVTGETRLRADGLTVSVAHFPLFIDGVPDSTVQSLVVVGAVHE